MKKYPTLNDDPGKQRLQEICDELKLFQFLLRNSEEMNVRCLGRALEIADGIQPLIETLEFSLRF